VKLELDDKLQHHQELQMDENIAAGTIREKACRTARCEVDTLT
jgi:hypothetical protein